MIKPHLRARDVPAITQLDVAGARHDVLLALLVPLLVMLVSALALLLLSNSKLEKLIFGDNKNAEK